MSCMADVHEVQEANDKSKFHRQIMGVVLCVITESVILILFTILFFSNFKLVAPSQAHPLQN